MSRSGVRFPTLAFPITGEGSPFSLARKVGVVSGGFSATKVERLGLMRVTEFTPLSDVYAMVAPAVAALLAGGVMEP